jgi:DNA-binding NarL/FixJ family response regulator
MSMTIGPKRAESAGRPAPGARRILLVDDHPLVRERLADVINHEPDLRVCGGAAERHEALRAIAASNPDLVIIDLNLKESDGLELIKDIRQRHPELRMLVVSMHDESLYAERALRAGAHGYITKENATTDILLAIRKVLAGRIYMSDTLAEQIATKVTGHRREAAFAPEKLSDRELSVFELIGQGFTLREIADQLHLDVKTVETYRVRIKEKLDLKDAGEVLKRAIQWNRTLRQR